MTQTNTDKFGRTILKENDRHKIIDTENKISRFLVVSTEFGTYGEELNFKEFNLLEDAERYFHLRVAPKMNWTEDLDVLFQEIADERLANVNGMSRTKMIKDIRISSFSFGFTVSFPDKRTYNQRGTSYPDTAKEARALVLKKLKSSLRK